MSSSLGPFEKHNLQSQLRRFRAPGNRGCRSSCSGCLTRPANPSSVELGEPRNKREPAGWEATALLGPPSVSQSNKSKDGAEQIPWRQAQPSDACLVQMESSSVFVLCTSIARSLSFLNCCSSSRNHES